jgi:hypothetical protein
MNKDYKYNPTMAEILLTFIGLIRDLMRLISPRLAEWFYSFFSKYLPKEEAAQRPAPPEPVKEQAKIITPPEEKPVTTSVPIPAIDLSTTKKPVAQPYIDRGPLLPEHYGDDRIVALAKDPHCIFVYWELKGFKSQEAMNYHNNETKSWFLRVHPSGEEAYHDVPINVDARNWYLWVADDKSYIIDLGFSTQHGEFLTLASSNPVQTPRSGTSKEYNEYWGFIFKEVEKGSTEGIPWLSPGGGWHEEGLFEAHVPGSPTPPTQKKGQGK